MTHNSVPVCGHHKSPHWLLIQRSVTFKWENLCGPSTVMSMTSCAFYGSWMRCLECEKRAPEVIYGVLNWVRNGLKLDLFGVINRRSATKWRSENWAAVRTDRASGSQNWRCTTPGSTPARRPTESKKSPPPPCFEWKSTNGVRSAQ